MRRALEGQRGMQKTLKFMYKYANVACGEDDEEECFLHFRFARG